jgi:cystathionine beta-lyase
VAVRRSDLAEQIYFIQNGEGSALGPFDCYLLLRGIKTLKLRFDAQQANAQKIAKHLVAHPAVKHVYFPGLVNHAGHDLHAKQSRGAGALISFETNSFEFSKQFVEATQIFRISVSFGSINSSISLPGCMSHASIPAEVRKARCLATDLVRLSVGIEDVDDLIQDLDRAFERAAAGTLAFEQSIAGEQITF